MADIDFQYTDEELINPDLICSICCNILNDPLCTSCKHTFCRTCITKWLEKEQTCPISRHGPIRPADLVPVDTTISCALNRLFVTCQKCGQSNIHLGEFGNHKNKYCPKILLSELRRQINNDIEALISPLAKHIEQLKKEVEHKKILFDNLNDKLKRQQDEIETIKQTNVTHRTKIEQLEDIIQTQNQQFQNCIKRCNDDSTENESQICNLWEKINQHTPYENSPLENHITVNCQFRSKLVLCDEKVTDRDVEIIAKRAIINRQCTSLVLRENEITYQGASIIADTFRQNIHLKKLDLSYNKLSDKGVRFLAEALLSNITLTELNLGSTGITNRGIIYLKETLQFNDTLEKLYLYENDIDDDGMKLLTDVLSEYNQSLTLLSLYSNRLITDESIDSLMDLFRQNRSLKRIELHQCSFSKEIKTRLQDAAENVLISICI